jgi:hypothetical protein
MNRPRYYDKDTTPIELMDWAHKFEDTEYKRVAETTLPDGTYISTVWLGLDHQFGDGPPLIFETMVFDASMGTMFDGDYTDHYTLLSEAEEGHLAVVLKVRAALDTDARTATLLDRGIGPTSWAAEYLT